MNNPFETYDCLSPAIRKAIRETGNLGAEARAVRLLKHGMSEANVVKALQESFDPISADWAGVETDK